MLVPVPGPGAALEWCLTLHFRRQPEKPKVDTQNNPRSDGVEARKRPSDCIDRTIKQQSKSMMT